MLRHVFVLSVMGTSLMMLALPSSPLYAQENPEVSRRTLRVSIESTAANASKGKPAGLSVRTITRTPRKSASGSPPDTNPSSSTQPVTVERVLTKVETRVDAAIGDARGASKKTAHDPPRKTSRVAKKDKLPSYFVFKKPVRNHRVTSRYGLRYHPLERKKRKKRKKMHKGIDYGAPKGTPILSTGPGTITHSGWGPRGEGICVFIKHPNNWVSIYLHMSQTNVKVGERVKSGQRIGSVGSTGRSTGPHLHFQVQKNGRTIDPLKILGKRSDKIRSP